ncbi:AraC family transcriptional regulator [Streptomyces sp. MS1.AVA.4]|uniref:AraC family transcriptional regulator n=1 Tax=Streptomyces pratisoli TaxID=3139917 RepID=A0ACC6Q995_9ACTN
MANDAEVKIARNSWQGRGAMGVRDASRAQPSRRCPPLNVRKSAEKKHVHEHVRSGKGEWCRRLVSQWRGIAQPVLLPLELLARTAEVGPNVSQWPGLTTYRFTLPQNSQWSESQSLALYCVLQGRKRVIANGDEYQFNALSYSLIARGLRFESDIVEASVENPYLSFVLQIDPAIVRAVSSRICRSAHGEDQGGM